MCGQRGPASASASGPSQCGCLRVRLSGAPSREFPFPVTLACPWSWAPGRGQEVFRTHTHPSPHTPLAAAQRPCAGRPAVLFHASSTKRLCFCTPGTSRPRRRAWEAGRGPARSTLAVPIRPLLSHAVWGSPLCLVPVISIQTGPWWPSPWCSCHRVRPVSGGRGLGSLRLAPWFRSWGIVVLAPVSNHDSVRSELASGGY